MWFFGLDRVFLGIGSDFFEDSVVEAGVCLILGKEWRGFRTSFHSSAISLTTVFCDALLKVKPLVSPPLLFTHLAIPQPCSSPFVIHLLLSCFLQQHRN
jgi:hypothetical protein